MAHADGEWKKDELKWSKVGEKKKNIRNKWTDRPDLQRPHGNEEVTND